MPDEPTQTEWRRRLVPEAPAANEVLVLHLEEAAHRLTSHPAVQRWLRDASFEAARGLEGPDAQAQAQAHSRIVRNLKERFPGLVEAVRSTTEGCGTVALQWRPLAPGYSQVHIDVGGAHDTDVFCRLPSPALSAAQQALRAVADALPAGRPFPNRPNSAVGMLGWDERCLGVRYQEHADGPTPERRVLLMPGEQSTDPLSEPDAARGVVAFFAPNDRETWYQR